VTLLSRITSDLSLHRLTYLKPEQRELPFCVHARASVEETLALEATRRAERRLVQETVLGRLAVLQSAEVSALPDPAAPPHPSLLRLWRAWRPGQGFPGNISREWVALGFQNDHPLSDCRAMGVLPLHCLAFLAESLPLVHEALQRLPPAPPTPSLPGARQKGGNTPTSLVVPLSAVMVNVVFFLSQLLSLPAFDPAFPPSSGSAKPDSPLLEVFVRTEASALLGRAEASTAANSAFFETLAAQLLLLACDLSRQHPEVDYFAFTAQLWDPLKEAFAKVLATRPAGLDPLVNKVQTAISRNAGPCGCVGAGRSARACGT
jgi:hypothetical protein